MNSDPEQQVSLRLFKERLKYIMKARDVTEAGNASLLSLSPVDYIFPKGTNCIQSNLISGNPPISVTEKNVSVVNLTILYADTST